MGKLRSIGADADTPLLWVLREELGLTGTKFGCGVAACGACTVHVERRAGAVVRASRSPARAGADIVTIEGLAAGAGVPTAACIRCSAPGSTCRCPQCGYCQSGMIMAAAALLKKTPKPDRRGDRRGHHQSVPLRHLSPRAPRDPRAQRRGVRRARDEAQELSDRNRGGGGRAGARLSRLDQLLRGQAAALVTGDGGSLLGGWVKIAPDDTVTVYMPHIDMGQGTHTALAMMLAEELDADWSRVRTERAPSDKAFANRFLAEGWILQGWRLPAFLDGAVDTAFGEAARFAQPADHGRLHGRALHGPGRPAHRRRRRPLDADRGRRSALAGRAHASSPPPTASSATPRAAARARYGELAAEAAKLSVPASPRFKPRQDYKIIGTVGATARHPGQGHGRGCSYGIDVQLPGMLYATVKAAPVHGGKLTSVDPAPALKHARRVERVIRLDDAVAVVAQGYWQASRGLAALAPVFSDGGNGGGYLPAASGRSTGSRTAPARTASRSTRAATSRLRCKGVPASRIVEATYHVPFLHHAAMEPINATAQFKDGKLTVWAGEQDALGQQGQPGRMVGPQGRRRDADRPAGGRLLRPPRAAWRASASRSCSSPCRWRRGRSR